MRSWFQVDGTLPPIEFAGASDCRFPPELVHTMLEEYSAPGDLVLDPFCGFGTTLQVCAELGRIGIGFEPDDETFGYASKVIGPPHALYHDRAQNIADYALPPIDLVFCSPPFRAFGTRDPVNSPGYYDVLLEIFAEVDRSLRPGTRVIVETVNLSDGSAGVPRAFQTALTLAQVFDFEREHICCQTSAEVVPGSAHSYLLVFSSRDTQRGST